MLKKFLSIFKRDKRKFSNEELEWQAKIGKRMKYTIVGILLVMLMIAGFKILDKLCEFFRGFPWGLMTRFVITFSLYLLCMLIMLGTIFFIHTIIESVLEEIDTQLKKNLKEKKEEKIQSCLEKKDFLKLGIKMLMIDEIFQMLFQSGILEIKPFGDEIMIILSESVKNADPLFIKKGELVDYFKVDDDEEK